MSDSSKGFNEKKITSREKTFPVPFPLKTNNKENIKPKDGSKQLSKKDIVSNAFRFHSIGNINNAVKYYKMFINKGFEDPQVFLNYSIILQDLGRLEEAEETLRKAIRLNTDYPKAYCNLATVLQELGKFKEAEISCNKAIKLDPELAEAYYNLANILKDIGKLKEAEKYALRAIKLKPDVGIFYSSLGSILREKGNLEKAELLIRKSIELNPKHAISYSNLGCILRDLGEIKEAEIYALKASKMRPNSSDIQINLSSILKDIGKIKEAELSIRKAIKIKPNNSKAYSNLGCILLDLNKLEEAELFTRKAIQIEPEFIDAHLNLSHILLRSMKFLEGWDQYEWRWKIIRHFKVKNKLKTSKPEWKRDMKQRVLLWPEQGLGDEILFLSLLPDMLKLVDKLIVQADKRLIPLLKRTFNQKIEFKERGHLIDEAEYDCQISMGSLPRILRPTLQSFECSEKRYLESNKKRSKELRDNLIKDQQKKLFGISWKTKNIEYFKSAISLEKLILAINSSDICFVSLQYGDVKEEINNVRLKHGIYVNEVEEIDNFNDIDGLSSLITACDEVISIENLTATLSASLGVKTNVLLPTSCYWPFGSNEIECYWFSSMKLFRQNEFGIWDEPLNEIKKELRI